MRAKKKKKKKKKEESAPMITNSLVLLKEKRKGAYWLSGKERSHLTYPASLDMQKGEEISSGQKKALKRKRGK